MNFSINQETFTALGWSDGMRIKCIITDDGRFQLSPSKHGYVITYWRKNVPPEGQRRYVKIATSEAFNKAAGSGTGQNVTINNGVLIFATED